MPFTLIPQVAKSDEAVSPHIAMALGDEEFRDEDGDSQMGTGADKPLRTGEAEKGLRHPASGRFVSGETAYGATHGPLAQAMAMHRPAQPLADLVTVPGPAGGALASSIASNPGAVNVAQLDYRTTGAPRPNFAPVRPDFHQSSNQPTGGQS